ncbi:Guanylate cyclase [Strongyloides ratti]|uniref:Guanylate cyclase n=1 Tax=Strongyloides ratti TaxID=34506 RepID=A0A090KWV4_STRRB|nr:Guanylate cyclase [Strongyloides ratti]CEF60352.1 Guanylate cyclase [Strongyloides ratti]
MIYFYLVFFIPNIYIKCLEIVKSSTEQPSFNTTIKNSAENKIIESSTSYINKILTKNVISKKNNTNIVKIGYIGSSNAMPGAEAILKMCRNELLNDKILDHNFDIQFVYSHSNCKNYEGVGVAVEMYHRQNVKFFIGPFCNLEMEAVSKMSAYWNIPVVGYMTTSNIFSNKNIYKTLARVLIKTNNNLAIAVSVVLKYKKWRKVILVIGSDPTSYERLIPFEKYFQRENITILKKITLDENLNSNEILKSGILNEIKTSGRIIICIFSKTSKTSHRFMDAVSQANLKTNEFVYIFPWLQKEVKESLPWIGVNGETDQTVKDLFKNTIIVDDIYSFNNTLMLHFKEKMLKNNIDINDLNLDNIFGYINLYDSLKLYVLVVKKLLQQHNGNFSVINNGSLIWNKMRRFKFSGFISTTGMASELLIMDDLAERMSSYAAFFVSHKKNKIIKVFEMEPILNENCDGLKLESGCFKMKLFDVVTNFWPSNDGKLPSDEPECGFRNEKCNYTIYIVIGIVGILLIAILISIFLILKILEKKALEKTPWRVWRDDMRLISEDEMKSILSMESSMTRMSNMSKFIKYHAILGTNTHASYHLYPQKNFIQFSREDIILLTEMKQLVHDNINPFIGISFNEKNEMLVLWKFCSRGTIQDIIYNENVTLDSKFHAAFIRDITNGLEYLHLSSIGYHGSLTPWCCLIDRNWAVKLTDYGIANPIEKWIRKKLIDPEKVRLDNDKSAATQKTNVLYCAPEVLKTSEENKKRRIDQSWIKQSQAKRQAGDIYAFGILMYEILFRKLPFNDEVDILELVDLLKNDHSSVRPIIHDYNSIHSDIAALLLDCWHLNPEIRPTIRRVKLNTENYLKVRGSLVDQMMRVMEQYANNLEKLVHERTGMLEEANIRADNLLSQLLPKYVANELKMGRTVPPKMFKEATVMFTDIVEFTKLCSNSTPLEVVNFLNSVYSGFDDIIKKYDAYKVETIGDAYMVVSGIPEENGNRHLANLADIALDIVFSLQTYVIPHRKDDKLKVRLGIHCGQIASGVVGLTAPRYCLFGDTVNTASRMESTGIGNQIQVTETYKETLLLHYPEFDFSLRGLTEVKGKGKIITYWLIGKNSDEIASKINNVP